MELWKTIDWNALIKVSDISHIYGIHENCDITEEFGYLGKSKLGCKQIDKEAEVTYVFYIDMKRLINFFLNDIKNFRSLIIFNHRKD